MSDHPVSKLLLEVEDLRVRVGEHEVLKGINLAIREGETHVLLSAAQVIATRGAFRPRNPRAA